MDYGGRQQCVRVPVFETKCGKFNLTGWRSVQRFHISVCQRSETRPSLFQGTSDSVNFIERLAEINIRRINKNTSLQYICIKLRTIYLSVILFLHSLKHTRETRGASGCVIHTLVFFFKTKSRHPQTLSMWCILIDGDIIQMNVGDYDDK